MGAVAVGMRRQHACVCVCVYRAGRDLPDGGKWPTVRVPEWSQGLWSWD